MSLRSNFIISQKGLIVKQLGGGGY